MDPGRRRGDDRESLTSSEDPVLGCDLSFTLPSRPGSSHGCPVQPDRHCRSEHSSIRCDYKYALPGLDPGIHAPWMTASPALRGYPAQRHGCPVQEKWFRSRRPDLNPGSSCPCLSWVSTSSGAGAGSVDGRNKSHGCPVQRMQLQESASKQPPIPVAGLVPAIHAFPRLSHAGFQDVDARNKSGQGVLEIVPAFPTVVLTL
jgi:hypothetical protein